MKRTFGAVALLAFALPLAGCDDVTLPEWDVTNRMAMNTETISIASVLPSDVEVDGEDFVLPATSIQDGRSIAQICPSCSAAEGIPVPYPAFDFEMTEEVVFPGDLVSTTLSGGNLALEISHDLPYDLLRSTNGTFGSIRVEVRDAEGDVVSAGEIRGAEAGIAANVPNTIAVNLAGVTFTPGMSIRVALSSPGSGGPHPMRSNARFTFRVEAEGLRARSITAYQGGETLEGQAMEIKLDQEVRENLLKGIGSGKIFLDLQFPFNISGQLRVGVASSQASAQAGQWTVFRSSALAQGRNLQTIEISAAQMDELLSGEGVFVSASGVLNAGVITLRPSDSVSYKGVFESIYTVNRK